MTVPSTTSTFGPLSGNGVTTSFGFSFRLDDYADVTAEEQIEVITTSSDGVDTVKTLTTDYTVSLNADQDVSPGGSVVFVTAPASGVTVRGRRLPDFTQQTALTNQGAYNAEDVEAQFDQQAKQILALREISNRSIRAPVGETLAILPRATDRASKFLAFNSSGDPTAATSLTGAPASTYGANFILAADAPAALTLLGVSSYIQTLLDDADDTTARATLKIMMGDNRLINPDFRVASVTSATGVADGSAAIDGWYVLTQTGTIGWSQVADPEVGGVNAFRLTQSQASAQRMGALQWIAAGNVKDLRSAITTLAGRAKLSASSDIRYAVVEWTGTDDSPTVDIVNDWTSAVYTTGNFFVAANINVLAVGEVSATAATARALTALNATLGASGNNIGIFIWTESTLAQNGTLDIWNLKYEKGAAATLYQPRLLAVERLLCSTAFFQTLMDDATSSAALATLGAASNPNAIINGDMNIWQRGTSFAALSAGAYCADRYAVGNTSAAVYTVSRSTDVPTIAQAGRLFNYSLDIQVTTADASVAAGDLVNVFQPIEGFNWLPLAGRANTYGSWCKAKKTGVYGVFEVNGGTDRSIVAEITINVADTWEFKTVTFAASPSAGSWDYTNGVGIYLGICLMAGSTFQTTANAWQTGNFRSTANQVNAMDNTANYFRTTGWKLEPGSVATMSMPKIFSDELAECQRYYQLITIASNTVFFSYYGGSAAKSQHYKFSPDMRTTPSLSITNSGVEYYSYAGVWTASTLSSWSTTSSGVEVSCASDGDGRGKLMRPGAGGVNPRPILALSAEL